LNFITQKASIKLKMNLADKKYLQPCRQQWLTIYILPFLYKQNHLSHFFWCFNPNSKRHKRTPSPNGQKSSTICHIYWLKTKYVFGMTAHEMSSLAKLSVCATGLKYDSMIVIEPPSKHLLSSGTIFYWIAINFDWMHVSKKKITGPKIC